MKYKIRSNMATIRTQCAINHEGRTKSHAGKRKAETAHSNVASKRPRVVSSNQMERLPKHELETLSEHFDHPELDTVHATSIVRETERRLVAQQLPRRVSDIEVPTNVLSVTETESESDDSDYINRPSTQQLKSQVFMGSSGPASIISAPLKGKKEVSRSSHEIHSRPMPSKSPYGTKQHTKRKDKSLTRSILILALRLFACCMAVGSFVTIQFATRVARGASIDPTGFAIYRVLMWASCLLQVYYARSLVNQKQNIQSTSLLLPDTKHDKPHLVFPGGGLFFFWQAGVCSYLKESGYDLTQVSMSGASAGAIVALLAISDVDFEKATEDALALVDDWKNPMGLQGKWSMKVRGWLDTLLPENAHEIAMKNELSIVVTEIPWFQKRKMTTFVDRDDLIEAILTTVHVPWFMDGFLTRKFRGKRNVDGFLPPLYSPLQSTRLSENTPHILIDWRIDPCYRYCTPIDMIKLLSPESIWGLLEQGKSYAQKREAEGLFLSIPKNGSSVYTNSV